MYRYHISCDSPDCSAEFVDLEFIVRGLAVRCPDCSKMVRYHKREWVFGRPEDRYIYKYKLACKCSPTYTNAPVSSQYMACFKCGLVSDVESVDRFKSYDRVKLILSRGTAAVNTNLEELRDLVSINQNDCTGDGSLTEEQWTNLRDLVKSFDNIREFYTKLEESM